MSVLPPHNLYFSFSFGSVFVFDSDSETEVWVLYEQRKSSLVVEEKKFRVVKKKILCYDNIFYRNFRLHFEPFGDSTAVLHPAIFHIAVDSINLQHRAGNNLVARRLLKVLFIPFSFGFISDVCAEQNLNSPLGLLRTGKFNKILSCGLDGDLSSYHAHPVLTNPTEARTKF